MLQFNKRNDEDLGLTLTENIALLVLLVCVPYTPSLPLLCCQLAPVLLNTPLLPLTIFFFRVQCPISPAEQVVGKYVSIFLVYAPFWREMGGSDYSTPSTSF